MARSTTLPLVVIALLAGLPLASGCSGCDKPADTTVDAAPAISATPASSSATVVAGDAGAAEGGVANGDEPARRGGRRGVSAAFFQSARTLEPVLPADLKKKIDDAEALAAPPNDTAAKDAARELHAELVAGIKAGKIDTAKLDPKYLALEKIATADHDKEIASLDALYAALDATQRKAVVASVRAKQAKRDERMGKMMEARGGPDGGRPNMGKIRIDRLTRGLELDADQQKKVDALAPKEDAKGPDVQADMKKRTETLLTAFERDGFDAKKSDAFDVKKNRAALEEETKLLMQILPILKPEQREKMAAKMERGPVGPSPHLPKRGGMGHRPLLEPEDDDFGP
ncbi:hypothetical protein BH11MYX4_BH11MYX4_37630 [soil metagenome]